MKYSYRILYMFNKVYSTAQNEFTNNIMTDDNKNESLNDRIEEKSFFFQSQKREKENSKNLVRARL